MKIAVIGAGYVGLVTAAGLASLSHDVTVVESVEQRREQVARGETPFYEPGLDDLLTKTLGEGRLAVAGDMTAAASCDVIFLAVQTPPGPEGAIDLSFLESAARSVLTEIAAAPAGRRVIAIRSTVVPGTATGLILPIVDELGLGHNIAVASNPEFLQEGSAVADFVNADRVVVGVEEPWAGELMEELYRPIGAPVVTTAPGTAELAKYASNGLLATLISYSNEIADVAEGLAGVDAEDALEILRMDRRLSPLVDGERVRPGILGFLRAGCGYGGSCLPKDLAALVASERQQSRSHPLLSAVAEVNGGRAGHLVDLAEEHLGGGLEGRKVGVLGVAFKGGTDDLRSSPGLRVVDELLDRGASVVAHDPLVGASRLGEYVARGVAVEDALQDVVVQAEACLITTDAPEFAGLGAACRRVGARPLVVDGRRARPLDLPDDIRYVGVGQGVKQPVGEAL